VDGREFRVQAACIDTGGHATQAVYDYVRKKISHRVWGIKGQGNSDQKSYPIWPGRPTLIEKKGGRVPVYILGTDASKDLIAKRLTIRDPGPGYMHFPAGRDEAYFEQIAAEKKVWEGVGGRRRAKWVCPKGKRNEALDCRVYATAALYGLKAINKSWEPDVFADRAGIPQASAATPSEREETSTETPAPPVKPAPRRIARRPVVVRSSFMSR
jgi:phage terminase large subunit GpA-like protein